MSRGHQTARPPPFPPSLSLGYLALAWLLGIAAAAFTGADPWAAMAAASALAALSFAWRPHPTTLALAALGSLLVLGASWRYHSTLPPDPPGGIARYNEGPETRFQALVDSEPEERGTYLLYRLSARRVQVDGGWQNTEGGVLLRASPFPRYRYGDLLEIRGRLETPPVFAEFDYREYLLRQGIVSIIAYPKVNLLARDQGSAFRAHLIEIRHRLISALEEALPEPEASLAAGILLGARSALPEDLLEDMNVTGTSHLVAVSGQNVTLVAAMVMAVLAWLIGRRPAAWLALAAVIGYALLVGGQPSVVRAAIMGSLYLLAAVVGRQASASIGLLIAGGAMTALDPQLAHDISFQLSFAATIGLMTLAPPLRDRLQGAFARWPALADFPLTRGAVELLAVTASAIALTLPITAVNFHRISLVAPLANLLAVPAFLGVALTGAAAAALGALVPPVATHLGWLAWPPAAYMITVIRLFADLPWAAVELPVVGTGHAAAYYLALAIAAWLLARRHAAPPVQPLAPAPPALQPLLPAPGLALILILSSALLWLVISAPPSGRLIVTFLDVGQGDAILIQGPSGHRILVDGGPSGEAIDAALGRHLPFYDQRIDLLILTHPQVDHLGGLVEVLERYHVGGVLASPAPAESAVYRAWRQALAAAGVPYTEAAAGQWVDLGSGTRLSILASPSVTPESGSVVARLSMGRVSILLTGDIGEEEEEHLLRSGADLRSLVLKVPHHGSGGSSSPPFLRRVEAIVDIISVGAENRYGHPAPEVLRRLEGRLILRTDLHGDITVSTDGQRLWVSTQRNP